MDLFEYMSMQRKKEESPLAVRMRPKNREYDECRFCADECNYFG